MELKLAITAKKGGVGKSTTAVLLHEALRQASKHVSLRDWDQQGTSSKALELILGGVSQDTSGTDKIIIYDTPPNLEHTHGMSRFAHITIGPWPILGLGRRGRLRFGGPTVTRAC